jgi:hypothetical protein
MLPRGQTHSSGMPHALRFADNHGASTRLEARHAGATDNLRAGTLGRLKQRLIEPVARQGGRRKRQMGDDMSLPLDQAKALDRGSPLRTWINAKLAKQALSFLTQEFATDHMARPSRALEDDDPDAMAGKLDGERSTSKSTTDSNHG